MSGLDIAGPWEPGRPASADGGATARAAADESSSRATELEGGSVRSVLAMDQIGSVSISGWVRPSSTGPTA